MSSARPTGFGIAELLAAHDSSCASLRDLLLLFVACCQASVVLTMLGLLIMLIAIIGLGLVLEMSRFIG